MTTMETAEAPAPTKADGYVNLDAPLLKKLLSSTSWANRAGMTPELRCLHIAPAGPGRALITTTDLETDLMAEVPALHNLTEPILVARDSLIAAVKTAKKGMTFEIARTDGRVTGQMGALVVPLDGQPAEDFPRRSERERLEGMAVRLLNVEILRDTAKFMSSDSARPVIDAIFLAGGDMVATDSYHLVKQHAAYTLDGGDLPGDVNELDAKGSIVPGVLVRRALKVIPKNAKWVSLRFDERGCGFAWEDVDVRYRMSGRVVEYGDYPNFQGLLDSCERETAWVLTGDRTQIVEAIKAVTPSKHENNPVRFIPSVDDDDRWVIMFGREHGPTVPVPSVRIVPRDGRIGDKAPVTGWNPEYLLNVLSGPVDPAYPDVRFQIVNELKPGMEVRHLGCADIEPGAYTSTRLIMPVR